MIYLILAMDKNRLIGKGNQLPWKLPADLAYFKKLTMGHTVVMGRKTFESIGKPLPGRKNVILTRNINFFANGCIVINSLDDVLKLGELEDIFVIGGAELYSLFLPYAQSLYITEIEHSFQGDTYFNAIDLNEWEIQYKEAGEKNEENPYKYYFVKYNRKSLDK